MDAELAYNKFRVKAEHFGLSKGISTDRGRFVLKFNEAYNRYVEFIISAGRSDEILYIQHLLVDDKELIKKTSHLDHDDFEVPSDYFKYSNLYGIAECSGNVARIDLFPIKDVDRNIIISDPNYKPSFIWQEAPFLISSNKIKAFKDGFEYNKLYLSYYKYPSQISLLNPENPESKFSTKNIDGDDKFIDRVISLAVGEFNIDTQNNIYQVNKTRAIQKA
jgi:hypothetical protein